MTSSLSRNMYLKSVKDELMKLLGCQTHQFLSSLVLIQLYHHTAARFTPLPTRSLARMGIIPEDPGENPFFLLLISQKTLSLTLCDF